MRAAMARWTIRRPGTIDEGGNRSRSCRPKPIGEPPSVLSNRNTVGGFVVPLHKLWHRLCAEAARRGVRQRVDRRFPAVPGPQDRLQRGQWVRKALSYKPYRSTLWTMPE